jgi:hypothetical protein
MPSIEALAAAERIAAIEDRDYAGYVGDVAKIIDEDFAKLALESTMLRCQLSHSRDAASAFQSSGEIATRNRDAIIADLVRLLEHGKSLYGAGFMAGQHVILKELENREEADGIAFDILDDYRAAIAKHGRSEQ